MERERERERKRKRVELFRVLEIGMIAVDTTQRGGESMGRYGEQRMTTFLEYE